MNKKRNTNETGSRSKNVIFSENEQETYEVIKYNRSKYTIDNNAVIFGSDPMTLTETKIIRLIISNVQSNINRNDFPVYQITIPKLASILQVSTKGLYNEIFNISKSLMGRLLTIRYENSKNWQQYHWVDNASYIDGIFTIQLSNQLKDLFLNLKGNFTIFDSLEYIMQYKCRYSISISEALVASINKIPIKRGEFNSGKSVKVEYSIEHFRWFTATQDKYNRSNDLRKRVVDPAVKEINEISDIYIESVSFEKKGITKSPNTIVFYVYDKKKREQGVSVAFEVEKMLAAETEVSDNNIFDKQYVMNQFNHAGIVCHPDQLKEIVSMYNSTSDFMIDFSKALQNADHDVVKYLLAIAKNKEKAKIKLKDKGHSEWDTKDIQKEFDEIVAYWNSIAERQQIEFEMAGVTDAYGLKKLGRKDKRVRENYYKLKSMEGETKDSVMQAIDIAAVSQFFLRTSGTFSFFMNPKNYFDIASGERDYDTELVNQWKMEKVRKK